MINIYSNAEKAAFAAIEEGIAKVNSSENFKNYLRFLTKFHQYSLHNTMLILRQCPHASYIAGYKTWQNTFKRQVLKGEKAIKILAPYYLRKLSDDGKDEYVLTYFKTVNVFDISQTVGDEIPRVVKELNGNSFEAQILVKTLEACADVPVVFKEAHEDPALLSGARGYFSTAEEMIVLNKRLGADQMAKTLCHEFAHSILHRHSQKSRAVKEIEAEALAFVICHYFRLDTGDYSFPYIATYAHENQEVIKAILLDMQAVAHEIIELLRPVYYAKSVLTKSTCPNILTGKLSTSEGEK